MHPNSLTLFAVLGAAVVVVIVLAAIFRAALVGGVSYVVGVFARANANEPLTPFERSTYKLVKYLAYTVAGALVYNLPMFSAALNSGAAIDWRQIINSTGAAIIAALGASWGKYQSAKGDAPLGAAGAAIAGDVSSHLLHGNDAKTPLIAPEDMSALLAAISADIEHLTAGNGGAFDALPTHETVANAAAHVSTSTAATPANASANVSATASTLPADALDDILA